MKVLLYGALADALGKQVEIDVPTGCSIADLRRKLGRDHPHAVQELDRSRAIIGEIAVADDYQTVASDKVEFLPPVSGG